jgi:hypothetical protein
VCFVERLNEWFGSPAATARTVVWLAWASLLLAVIGAVLYGAGLLAITILPF